MRTEIIQQHSELKREVWVFWLNVDVSRSNIYLEHYSYQTKEKTRHKWKKQTHWDRLMPRENNIPEPPLPEDIKNKARSHFTTCIMAIPIVT